MKPLVPDFHHCVACGSARVVVIDREHFVVGTCRECDTVFAVEFGVDAGSDPVARVETIKGKDRTVRFQRIVIGERRLRPR